MTYEEACSFVESTKKYGSILGLAGIRNLMELLGNVQEELKIIHVAGTNGKGSVCAFLSSALMENGYRVGRFNSPAVFESREVFLIGNTMISETEYADIMQRAAKACEVLTAAGKPHPTSFEVETAAAFLWFYEQKCDLVLLETGMGGETDATNLITSPLCSVLTSISMDHMQFLGDTMEEIARVKAGIIKRGCPVAAFEQEPEVNQVIRKKADERNAFCTFAELSECREIRDSLDGISFIHPHYGRVTAKLSGAFQIENLCLALKVLEVLEHKHIVLEPEKVRKGIAKTAWSGRFEILNSNPYFIIDGAHNPAAVKSLIQTIQKYFTNREIIYIIGILADKNRAEMEGEYLSGAKHVYTFTPENPRALDGRVLAKEAGRFTKNVTFLEGGAKEAVKEALKIAGGKDVILAFGSLSYLGEVRKTLLDIKKEAESTGERHG